MNHPLARCALPLLILTLVSASDARDADAGAIGKPIAGKRLPVYTGEEIAAPRLDELVREQAKRAGVSVLASQPVAAVEIRPFIAVPLQLRIDGPGDKVIAFLSSIDDAGQFRVVSQLSFAPDRKDPDKLRAEMVVRQWYASNEEASEKTKQWRASRQLPMPAKEILSSVNKTLAKNPARLTHFELGPDRLRVRGKAKDLRSGTKVGGALFEGGLSAFYDLSWEQRPTVDVRVDDGSVRFAVAGKPKAKKSKE